MKHSIAVSCGIVMALGLLAVPLGAQRAEPNRMATTPEMNSTHVNDILGVTTLIPDPESDEVIPGMQLRQLSDGQSFATFQIKDQRPGPTSFSSRAQVYVAIDIPAGRYRTFKHEGPIEKDPRIKAYLLSQYGLHLDDPGRPSLPASPSPQAGPTEPASPKKPSRSFAALGLNHLRTIPPRLSHVPSRLLELVRTRPAGSLATVTPGDRLAHAIIHDRHSPDYRASAAQDGGGGNGNGYDCYGWAYAQVITLDLVDYLPGVYHLLTMGRSDASAELHYDTCCGYYAGWGDAFSWSVPSPSNPVHTTPFGTNWILTDYNLAESAGFGFGQSEQDAYMANVDFAMIILGHPEWMLLTWVENYTFAGVNAESYAYSLSAGAKGGGYAWPFLSFDTARDYGQICYPYSY